MKKEELEEVIKIIETHDEGDGDYCDTGGDMDWYCRSHCTEKAVERLRKQYDSSVLTNP